MSRGSLSRRDMLATLLGAPFAAAGCGAPAPPPIAGEIVGPSVGLGHRLRDGYLPVPPAGAWTETEVVIIGGGVAGLSAAWRLRHAGLHDFRLLELESAPGGTARSGESSFIAYPWGAHYIPAPTRENPLLVRLFEELGVVEGRDAHGEPVVAEQYLCRDPEERLFYKGFWYQGLYLHIGASTEDLAELNRFHSVVDAWVRWRDGKGRRAFTLPVASCSDDPEVTALDRMTMAEWLGVNNFRSPRLLWMVDYACRDDYGSLPADTSAWAGLFYFVSRIARPGDDSQSLVTWPAGNGWVVRQLSRPLAEQMHLGMAVADVVPTDPNGWEGVEVVAVDGDGRSVRGFRCKRVIFAAPQFLTRYLIRPFREQIPRHTAEFEYGSWIVANLELTGRPAVRGFPLCWDNVLYESPSLGYVVATHQRGMDHGPTVFTYYYPFCDADAKAARARLLGMDWDACTSLALADLQRAHHDLRRLVRRVDVMRWGHAMIRPRPGFQWGTARRQAAQPHRGIHFAHADLSGVGLFEEALYHGVRAAEEVLAARGRKDRSFLDTAT